MNTKIKIFWFIMGILIFVSFGLTAYRYLIKKDYIIQAQTDCDPYTEACFVWECDINSEEEGEKCTGNPDEDIWYYKIIKRNASRIPLCDSADENCQALICEENEAECEFILCTEENKEGMDSSECINPINYAIENPLEEECSEEDEACAVAGDEETDAVGGVEEEESMVQTTDDMISSKEGEAVKPEEEAGALPIVE